MSNDYQECLECHHDLDRHYKSVRGRVRCLHVERGISSSGIIGLPYEVTCDCVDGKSARAEERRAEARKEKEWHAQMVRQYMGRKSK